MALRQQHQQQQQQPQHQHQHQHQHQPSWPESLAAMAAYPFQMNRGGLLGSGGGGGIGGAELPAASLHPPPVPGLSMGSTSGAAMTVANGAKKEERTPGQWGHQETKDLIAIRSELERNFTQAKRNKSLWETIATKMKEKGYHRSGEQCKLKWKNLYNRYKAAAVSQGLETCPFYDELHAIFSDPRKAADGLYTEVGSMARKGNIGERSSEDVSCEDDDEEDESEEDNKAKRPNKKPRKGDPRERARPSAEKCRANSMQEVLEEFFQQQQRMEMEWMEALQRREEERRRREQEWRESVEKLERERMAREQVWREREEQRRAREEVRAKQRDALFSALWARLVKEE